jgi:hypothetical protein
MCYICGMDKPAVHIFLYRWKDQEQHSKSIEQNITYGIIFIIFMFLV